MITSDTPSSSIRTFLYPLPSIRPDCSKYTSSTSELPLFFSTALDLSITTFVILQFSNVILLPPSTYNVPFILTFFNVTFWLPTLRGINKSPDNVLFSILVPSKTVAFT